MASFGLTVALLLAPVAQAGEGVPAAAGAPTPPPQTLPDVSVVAPEPRYVAPTRRDRIGRIWAPVHINGQGPFRLVLDTGATHSAVTARVAQQLGIALDEANRLMLHGATGSRVVPTIPVETLEVGELLVEPGLLPIVPDALGGADGVLGTEGLGNKRIVIEFRNDRITIRRSRNEHAQRGFLTVPVTFERGRLMIVSASLGGVRAKAIIDTGGQATLGNLALRDAMSARRRAEAEPDQVIGTTLDVQDGDRLPTPSLMLGGMLIRTRAMTFADLEIFRHWGMTEEPALLIGMDVLGLLDTLVIDYRRAELQIRLRGS